MVASSPTSNTEQKAAPQLKLQWHTSVDSLEKQWNECFNGDQAMRSFALQKAVEKSKLSDAEFYHLEVTDEQGLAALFPCFVMTISLVTVASPSLQKFIEGIRKIFPKFLYMRMFFLGSAFSTSDDLIGIRDLTDIQRWSTEKLRSIFDEVIRKAKSVKTSFVIVKELPLERMEFLKARLDPKKFFFPESLPTAYLSVATRERGGYLQSIRTKYRNKLKKRKAVAIEKGLYWIASETDRGHIDRMFDLHCQVMDHAEVAFERLNKEFFYASREFFWAEKTKLTLNTAFYTLGFQKNADGNEKNEKLICSEFILANGNTLYPLYTGFDYEIKEDSDLYFNAYYALIDAAEKRGFTNIHLGQTAYEVKAELGCTFTRLFLAFYHSNPLLRMILRATQKIFFALPKFPHRDVFATPPEPPKNQKKAG